MSEKKDRPPRDPKVDLTSTLTGENLPRPLARTDSGEVTTDIQVEVIGGPMDGLRQRVSKEILTIGRGEIHDLSLGLDRMVSTNHAAILREGEHYWLEDLDSRNGTFIGDERIDRRTLIGPGTIFIVGRTPIQFMPYRSGV
ncbi:MAG: FHA domain-containing protein [Planctomycetota bacterium]